MIQRPGQRSPWREKICCARWSRDTSIAARRASILHSRDMLQLSVPTLDDRILPQTDRKEA